MAVCLFACQNTNQESKSEDTDQSKINTIPEFLWENATIYFMLTDRFHNGNPDNDQSFG